MSENAEDDQRFWDEEIAHRAEIAALEGLRNQPTSAIMRKMAVEMRQLARCLEDASRHDDRKEFEQEFARMGAYAEVVLGSLIAEEIERWRLSPQFGWD